MAGKAKRNSKKDNNLNELINEENVAEKLSKLREREEEREKMWLESWNKKIQEQERMEDCKACCSPDEFFPKPKTQSNIWVQINHEKNTQQVQMSFKNVPVSKPKPPPLPKLKIIDVPVEKEESESNPIIDGKKGSKKKKT